MTTRSERHLFDLQRGHLFNWVPVAYGLGIALYFSLLAEPGRAVWLSLAGVTLLAFLAFLRWPGLRVWPLLIGLVVIALGFQVAGLRTAVVAAPKIDWRYYGPVEGRIVEIDRSQSDAVRLTMDRVRLTNVAPDRLPSRVRVSLHGRQGYLDPAPGQTVTMTAHLGPPAGPVEPGGYDFRRQAWFERIGAVGYTRTPALLYAPPEPGGLRSRIAAQRHKVSERVRSALPGETGAVAAAITTGDRSAIPREVMEDLRVANLAHLLAISGLHMGLLTGVLLGAARLGFAAVPALALRRPVKKWAACLALAGGAFYLALSGGNVATERAFIMVAVMLGAVLLDRRAITLRAVAIAAMIVLTLRPEALLGVGFQMSFAATTALVAVFGWLRDMPGERRATRVGQWAFALVLSSLVAGLATAPFAASEFNRVPHYGLIANVVAVPVMGAVIMPAAVLAAVLTPLGLEWIGLGIMGLGLEWILTVAETVAGWPGAVSHVVTPEPWVVPTLVLGALWGVLWQGRARLMGVVPVVLALALWSGVERPSVLIADTGRLVGIMTPDGRALSKPKGDGFSATVWLENDGDDADQIAAAERWPAGPGARVPWEKVVHHATGRGAAEKARVACQDGAALVVASVDVEGLGGCNLIDASTLRMSGAVALYGEWPDARIVTVSAHSGVRPWSR